MSVVTDPWHRLAWSWISLVAALALHVAEEALTGFLEFYNPTVSAIREQVPYLPLPTFSFEIWIAGLVTGILLLLGLSVFAFRQTRWITYAALILGTLMVFNGALHIAGSFLFKRPMPGVYTSPLLMIVAVYLILNASRTRQTWLGTNRSKHPSRA